MKTNTSFGAIALLLIALMLIGSLAFLPMNISYAVGGNITFTSGETISFGSTTEMTFWSGISMIFGTNVTMQFLEFSNGNGLLEQCDWIQIVWPQGYLPNPCSWWEVLASDGTPLGEFHIDMLEPPYLAHVDTVWVPTGGPILLPPAPVTAVKKIEVIEPCQYYEVHWPRDWYPLPNTWWEIIDPETGHATGYEFHVDWTNESCEFHIDEITPGPYVLPFPWYEVEARRKITTIAPCDWFEILMPSEFNPAPSSWWEIVYMGEPTGLEFHVDESEGGIFHVDEVSPDPLKIPPTYPTVARQKIDVIQPCEWFRVHDLSLTPMPCTWWKIIDPDLGDIEFHVDESYQDGTFHIDEVWPDPIRLEPTYEIAAEKKIDGISQCNWFKVIDPPGWLPQPCSWWRIVWPTEWAGVTFHVDGTDGISKFHIDFADQLPHGPVPPPWSVTAEPIEPPPDPRWYTKPPYPDYAPSGMPDFDQSQDMWGPGQGIYTWCGPVAVANSLWWLDSEYESLYNLYPVPPPAISDSFPLVTAYGQWDDHDVLNVDPLVRNLAWLMDTDDQQPPFDGHSGTRWQDMESGISQYLVQQGVPGMFEVHSGEFPEFEWIENETERCQDVVLFLEFWSWTGLTWQPLYDNPSLESGHFVTCAGVNSTSLELLISDPYWDAFESQINPKGRSPVPHVYPHPTALHNDAQFVSQDAYQASNYTGPPQLPPSPYGVPVWELVNYLQYLGYNPSWHAFIRAAVVTSPLASPDIAVTNARVCYDQTHLAQNRTHHINVTVTNEGLFVETFTLTAYWNATNTIGSTSVSLAAGETKVVTIPWIANQERYRSYVISAVATPVLGEIDTADNTFVGPTVKIVWTGDVDGDRQVGILDVVKITGIYAVKYPNPQYKANSDIDCDGSITILDVVLCTGQYAHSEP